MSSGATSKRSSIRRERRKSSRTEIAFTRFPVLITSQEMREAGEETATGVVTDVGRLGLGLFLDRPIKSGTIVTVSIQHRNKSEHDICAEIIWNNPMPSSGRIIKNVAMLWRIGLKFAANAGEGQREAIEALLRTAQAT